MAYKKCKHLLVNAGPSGRIIVRKDDLYKCLCEPDAPKLPVSMTKQYGFKWPLEKTWVGKSDCAKCPYFTPE